MKQDNNNWFWSGKLMDYNGIQALFCMNKVKREGKAGASAVY